MELAVAEKFNPELEIIQINTTLDRILNHHQEFKQGFDKFGSKIDLIMDRINAVDKDRIESMQIIRDELKTEFRSEFKNIYLSIIGGAMMFIGGIIMWIIETKK